MPNIEDVDDIDQGYEPDVVQNYLDANPANLSPEMRAKAAAAIGIPIAQVNKAIDLIAENYTKDIDPNVLPPTNN